MFNEVMFQEMLLPSLIYIHTPPIMSINLSYVEGTNDNLLTVVTANQSISVNLTKIVMAKIIKL